MGTITRLKTRPDRLRQDQADVLRQALLPFEDQMPADAFRAVIGHIDRQTASRERWTFVMLSPEQNGAVVRYLAENSKRPLVAVMLWALCFEHLRHDTGEILLTRKEIAEKLGQKGPEVSAIMSELAAFGAITRLRNHMVHDLQDNRRVHYYMNPRVGTHLTGMERDEAQADAPLLRLIETETEKT